MRRFIACRFARAVLVLAALGLAAAPWLCDTATLALLTEFLVLLVLALMWNLLAGYGGIITVGQHGFVGVGAYAFYALAVHAGMSPYTALPLAGVVAMVVAIPAMAVLFRLRAVYLAIGTWVVAEVLMLAAGKLPGMGQGSGVSLPLNVARSLADGPAARFTAIYVLAYVLAVLAFGGTWLLLRSRVGLGLTAMRDNEESAAAYGVNVRRARLLTFLWTAPFLGLAGAIITLQKLRISPGASFSINDWTVFIIFNVVIGGIGTLEGPILGTLLFFVLREFLAPLGSWHLIILGAVSIIVILFEPAGLWGLMRRLLGFDLIPVTRKASAGFGQRLRRSRTPGPGDGAPGAGDAAPGMPRRASQRGAPQRQVARCQASEMARQAPGVPRKNRDDDDGSAGAGTAVASFAGQRRFGGGHVGRALQAEDAVELTVDHPLHDAVDAGHVRAGQRFGAHFIAIEHGAQQFHVLGRRTIDVEDFRIGGEEAGAKQKNRHTQAAPIFLQQMIARQPQHGVVHRGIVFGERAARLAQAIIVGLMKEGGDRLSDAFFIDALGAARSGEALQQPAQLEELGHIAARQLPHHGAAVRMNGDQAVAFQAMQRLA